MTPKDNRIKIAILKTVSPFELFDGWGEVFKASGFPAIGFIGSMKILYTNI